MSMNDRYVYQIQGALENAKGELMGLRVILCTANYFDTVDVPAHIIDKDTLAYIKFRLNFPEPMNITKLPFSVQDKIRAPLGRWLDRWVLENLHGNLSKRKNTNT